MNENGTQYLRMAKSTAQLALRSPAGTRIDITITAGTIPDEMFALIDAAILAEEIAISAGWSAADDASHEAAPLPAGPNEPTFCGYVCSPTTDDRGLPAWIMVDGRQAERREKQGDTWWSYRLPDGSYSRHVLIRKGEQAPAIWWPPGMKPAGK